MNDQIIIGNNIKSYRASLGLKQEQLADLIGVSRGAINYYENGKRIPNMMNLQKLSDLFGIEPIELIAENKSESQINSTIAFKKKSLTKRDLQAIACFRRISKNFIKLTENY